jgi:glycosyltransferase involved in cell wall biosynthesis
MRVLHVAPTVAASDGTSGAVLAMFRALRDETDVDAQLLAGEYDGMALHPGLPRDSSVQILRVRQPLGGRLGYTVGYPPGFARVLMERAASVDLVHIHGLWLYPTLLGGPILRRLRRSYVLSLHGGLMTHAMARSGLKKRIALSLFERKNIESASVAIATSQAELDQLRSLALSVTGKLLPLAIDPAALAFLARARKTKTLNGFEAPRARTILCVSRFHSQKRLVEIIQAFTNIGELFPEWRLRIVGPDSEYGYRAKVTAAARESRVGGRISVESAIEGESLWRTYQEADLFLLASTFESFGLVIAEALAAGVPVISTRATPWPQLVDQRCGWWIDRSLDTLESTLKDAMSTPQVTLRDMGRRGSRLIEEDFSPRALGSGLASLYQSVVDGSTASTRR